MKRFEELWSKIRDLTRSITKNSDDYDKKYRKFTLNSDDYPRVLLNECLYKI